MWVPRVLQKRLRLGPRVCAPRLAEVTKVPIRVWGSYRTNRNSGYRSVAELIEVPGVVARAYRTHTSYILIYPYPGYLWHSRTDLPEVPGTGMNVLQNFSEIPGTGMNILQSLQGCCAGRYLG